MQVLCNFDVSRFRLNINHGSVSKETNESFFWYDGTPDGGEGVIRAWEEGQPV